MDLPNGRWYEVFSANWFSLLLKVFRTLSLCEKIHWYGPKSPNQQYFAQYLVGNLLPHPNDSTKSTNDARDTSSQFTRSWRSWWDLWGCRIGTSRRWPSPNPRKMHNYYPWLTSHWSARCCWWQPEIRGELTGWGWYSLNPDIDRVEDTSQVVQEFWTINSITAMSFHQ